MKVIITTLLVLIVTHLNNVHASGLPEEVRQFAKQNSCSEVKGFYERPGMVEPAYHYGYVQTINKSESVTFWCQSNKDVNTYKLIVTIKDKFNIVCSDMIYKTKNFPGGLSYSTENASGLSGYRSDLKHRNEQTCGVEGVVINSFYDGTGYTFIFHNGTWMYKMWD